ncbi:serine/arginine repetitive matrix protein 3 isoform X1 [Pygocentrus nattereri]|uniref:CWF21 domain-containing protein n=1 Tax=Pygocentrus nattereri TaxID=42514 RepID=A0A3B4BUC6_PYGNA|nr:serine/arginine repetitive matrix protein 3 isoform X1 [Pygocentrus nattereri]XP_037389268.1 serine/arginine repetitive matrix protein 3 isoform X1 [Pygocentrus nattereri]
MYDGARVPSPGDAANGVPLQPAMHPKADDEPEEEKGVQQPEPVLVKKAHREILDHERKRRVELKCMELQEMMEEQGYSEEEIRQKVGTFRQMLMEKEGVITREGSHPRPPVTVLPHGDEEDAEGRAFADGYEEDYGWQGDYYDRDSVAHDDYSRAKRKSSSSPSPAPKKRKKKKGRRHSRVDSSSPTRRGKRKKSGKKHKRDRSTSGSRRKRRHRSGTPKNKHKDKSKLRKKSPVECASRRPQHRGSCCSSRSASVSSVASISKSPSRSNPKHRSDGHKPSGRSSHSPSPSLGPDHATYRQNGHHSNRVRNGKDSGPNHLDGEKANDKLRSLASSSPSEAQRQTSPSVREAKSHGASSRSPGGLPVGEAGKGDERQQRGAKHPSESSGRRGGRQRAQEKSGSPAHSSDSQPDLQPKAKSSHQKKTRGSHSSKKHHRGRGPNRHHSTSASPGRHRHTSGRKKSKSHGSLRQRSSSWSSDHSSSRSNSREHAPNKTKSPHTRQNNSRERDSPHYSDAERARRRSRSYSPIRKRRRDSPSFMEARRITSARKRPIPYYRPSPSSSSSASSYSSSSRSRSRSYDSYSSYSRSRSRSRSRSKSSRSRSRSRSKSSRSRSRSFSRSPSQAHSYYSHSSYESPGF